MVKKKKIIILIIVILLLIIAGGVFWWWQNRETPPEKWSTAKVSSREDYIIKEVPEGKIVENKKVGLSFEIPNNWTVEEETSFYTPYIAFYSPDIEIDEMSYLPKQGCKIVISVRYIKTNLDTFEKSLKENWPSPTLNKFERIEINGQITIKHTFEDENLKMYGIGIHVPTKNKLYEIALDASLQDKEQCEIEFNKFLETVSINPVRKFF